MKLVTNVEYTSPTGGLEVQVLQVSRELARRGHEVNLLYKEAGSLVPEYQRFCRSVTGLRHVDYWYPDGRRVRPRMMAEMLPAIWAAARRLPDVMYGNRVESNGWAIPAGMLTSTPVVTHQHGFGDLGPKRIRFLNDHVARFIMISQFIADPWLDVGLDPSKVEVVHNGIDPAEYPFGGLEERSIARMGFGLPDDCFVVTYLGRLDPEKGVEVLLEAWRLLGLAPDEARLLVVGSAVTGPDPERYVAELTALADEHVQFVPAQRDVIPPLHAADVVVVPSTWNEPFGRVIVEAMSTGRPVIASRVGGIPEILTGPLERFLFERGDAPDLAHRIRSVMDWRTHEPGLGRVCADRVEEEFTLAGMVDALESVFRAVT